MTGHSEAIHLVVYGASRKVPDAFREATASLSPHRSLLNSTTPLKARMMVETDYAC
jgi:hypothetical protein